MIGPWRSVAPVRDVALSATAVSVAALGLGFVVVAVLLGPGAAMWWLLVAAAAVGMGLSWLRRQLDRREGDALEGGSIGPATWITTGRGLLVASLAGGLVLDPAAVLRGGALPGAIYGLVVAGDYLDGTIARATDRVTALGARLDTEVDAAGLLVASLLGIHVGLVPAWYLPAGLARYGFVGGILLRRRRGRPVHPLPARRGRRWLAGLQMTFLTVALLSPLEPATTAILAAGALLPFLAGFLRDWLLVTGRLGDDDRHPTDGPAVSGPSLRSWP